MEGCLIKVKVVLEQSLVIKTVPVMHERPSGACCSDCLVLKYLTSATAFASACLAASAILVGSVMGEPYRRLEHKISLHKAASEVRYIVIFNNGSTTGPNGVSELSLAPLKVSLIAGLNAAGK
jgi:hypothetical protein